MNHSSLFIASLLLVIIRGEAQTTTSVPQADSSQDLASNFQPSLAVVIGILCIMFSATFILILYAKFCYRGTTFHAALQNGPGLLQSGASRFSGIDKTVIESLPFFKFSSLGGSRQGLECAVCLSKFEDIEVLRLLPKCRHAFHIDCIDQWLDKHSSCPLCRCKVCAEDLATLAYSHSMRSLMNLSEGRQDSNIELFVQREEIRQGSWRLNIGNSFRKPEKCSKEEQSLIQEETEICTQYDKKPLHKFHHEIIVSDVVLKNRWSNVSSSDLIYLNSEMLNHSSSDRFSALDSKNGQLKAMRTLEDGQIVKIKEEMEIKRLFESKISTINKGLPSSIPLLPSTSDLKETKPVHDTSRGISPSERRSISEITAFSRFRNVRTMIREPSLEGGSNVKEERLRQLWLRIARRTVQWFANRERRSEQTESPKHTLPV